MEEVTEVFSTAMIKLSHYPPNTPLIRFRDDQISD